jgi:serine protease AprX
VYLTTQADLSPANKLSTKLEKGTYVYHTLSATAEQAQKSLVALLDQLGVAYRSFWIANMVWVRGDLTTIQLMAARLDVAHLYANPTVKLDATQEVISTELAPQGIEWNIHKVNADDVWARGFTGQGVVIGGQDTGYAWDHPAIKNQYRGWDGALADHNYNWFDATADHSPTPIDPYGHGTHTMGTMVGDDGGNNRIGMAPGARWIGCRNMDAGGNGTPETYATCYQWFVAPTDLNGNNPQPALAPDVISNSWSCPPSEGCTDPNMLLIIVQNLVAAGIVSSHSAGNAGSTCSTVNESAAIYAESFTVGATDYNDTIASFSSHGPVAIDGSNRPKPDISAPGVNVRSCIPGGGYASYSGTSMASPHVAGEVALLISANPNLRGQVDQIESTIEQSAYHIPWIGCSSDGVPNNAYGWGRIDALAAVNLMGTLSLKKVASAPTVFPGDLLTYTLSVSNLDDHFAVTNVVLTDTLPFKTTFVLATPPYALAGDVVHWDIPSLEAQSTLDVLLVVQVDRWASDVLVNADYSVTSDQAAFIRGASVSTAIGQLFFLPFTIKTP